jgi:hypothetical protein
MSTTAPLQNQAAKSQPLSNSAHAGLLLQRKCACGSPTSSLTGECAECKNKKRLQTKLAIGASNDPLELEADRVADQVLAAPAHSTVNGAQTSIQRYTGQASESTDTVPASVDRTLAGTGRPLEPALRQDMEQRFGHDFSRVRVHAGAAAEQSAREVNAKAYTVGHNVVFGAGRFSPGSQAGRHLLAHELTHVLQQGGAGPNAAAARADTGAAGHEGATKAPSVSVAQPGSLRRMNMFECARMGVPCPPAISWPEICRLVYCTRAATANLPGAISPGVCVYQCSAGKICACVLVGSSTSAVCTFRICSGGSGLLGSQDGLESFAGQALAAAGNQPSNEQSEEGKTAEAAPTMQAKLMVNTAGDQYEQEADRVADQVIATSTHSEVSGAQPRIQRYTGQESEGAGSAPASVDRVLASSGRPLDPATRSFMEPRFGHDFSGVRVHTDGQAAESARDVYANAYTVGHNIVFDSGRFAPGTHEGRRLIAHELAHVLQQSIGPAKATQIQRQPAAKPAHHTLEESDKSSIKAFGLRKWLTGIISDWRDTQARYVAATAATFHPTEQLLTGILSASQSRLTLGEAQISTALNGDPVLLKEFRDSYLVMISVVVPKFASLTGKRPSEVFQAHHREIHELALPPSTIDAQGAQLSDALPAAERQRIQVSTTEFDLGNIEAFFVVSGNVRVTSVGDPVRFATNVPAGIRGGLENIARELARGSNRPNAHPLPPNQTITLSLNLERFGGGNAAYRFTYVEHPATTRGGQPTREFLVERVGTIGVEGLAANQVSQQQLRFERHAFVRDRTFSSDAEYEAVLEGLSQIGDASLTPIDGLRFQRDRVYQIRPIAAGVYDPITHTITLFDSAFRNTPSRVGRSGEGMAGAATFTLRHEIGHAIDQARTRLNPAPRGAVKASATPEFRLAAQQDGNVRITTYADTNWVEFYAESFALYESDPTGLRRLRPNLFNYFARLFPR